MAFLSKDAYLRAESEDFTSDSFRIAVLNWLNREEKRENYKNQYFARVVDAKANEAYRVYSDTIQRDKNLKSPFSFDRRFYRFEHSED